MRRRALIAAGLAICATAYAATLDEQNEALFTEMRLVHSLTPDEMTAVRAVFEGSQRLGQGNPAVAQHAATPEQCREKIAAEGVRYGDTESEHICGDRFMSPLYDPATQTPADATSCIDQFEFPNIPCAWPVVWVRADEAAQLCAAVGKRLCDAHEWEGGCQGALTEPDYDFDAVAGMSQGAAQKAMRSAHNARHKPEKRWAYGESYQRGICGTGSFKNEGCDGGNWSRCGSNTYPTGYFPQCVSPLGVYDIHGNAAEHMNLPLTADQMASRGSTELGVTEMKGSWFIFDTYYAHQDWCRWRAPYWHGGPVMAEDSHFNYHLGFRCCKSLGSDSKPIE